MKESGHSSDGGDKPIIITMEELHSHGGTPPGWRFRIPEGDVAGGREAFVKMECFACHNIDGEKFPKKEKDPAKVGPDLSGKGAMHGDRAYFFESLINPNRVIVKGPGYVKEGNSIMPSYADSMTLQEAVDLVAYLKSLKGGHKMGGVKKNADHGGGMKDMKKH
jgi:mono/diheme cytochrome c family protein